MEFIILLEFIHWTNKLICQNGIRCMSEECQDTIRWLLIVQIVLIWYWSQSTTGVITLDSFYEESIFWSLYMVESEHKDSLNRGFTAPAIIFIILLCISWFSRVVSNHPNCHHHILHAKLRVGMVPKSLFATKMLQLCFHCLIYMYIWLCRVQGLTYDRCIQVLHLVHTKQIFDHMPKNCFVQYMQIHNSLKKKTIPYQTKSRQFQ